jgi:thiol-disulfide isomerase/thioredoxin
MKTVIKYGAAWCGPCKMYAPKFNEAATTISGVNFQSVDVDSGDPRIIEHGIRNVPTTVVIDENGNIRKQIGIMSVEQLKAFIG